MESNAEVGRLDIILLLLENNCNVRAEVIEPLG